MLSWIAAILDSRAITPIGRVLLTFMFWTSALLKFADWNGGVAEMVHFGLNPPLPFHVATVAVLVFGSVLVISGRYVWLGAAALAVFTAMTIPIAHAFWKMTPPSSVGEMYTVMEHVSIIGALLLVTVLDRREKTRV